MSAKPRGWDRPVASIEELVMVVRRESAAAVSTAEEFLPDAPVKLQLPRRFPIPGRAREDGAQDPRDEADEPPGPTASGSRSS